MLTVTSQERDTPATLEPGGSVLDEIVREGAPRTGGGWWCATGVIWPVRWNVLGRDRGGRAAGQRQRGRRGHGWAGAVLLGDPAVVRSRPVVECPLQQGARRAIAYEMPEARAV